MLSLKNHSNAAPVTGPIKAVIADDHKLILAGFKEVLDDTPGITLCASFPNGKELLDWYDGSNADVILMDIQMPVLDGIEASKQILARFPAARIIVLSIDDHNIKLMQYIGAYAYLLKSGEPEDLIAAIIKVRAGEKVFAVNSSSTALNITANKGMALKISERERQVLKYIAEGKTNKQVAAALDLSPHTIKKHREHLLGKLAASNTAQLLANAGLNGLL